jgi:hypothetical protein
VFVAMDDGRAKRRGGGHHQVADLFSAFKGDKVTSLIVLGRCCRP